MYLCEYLYHAIDPLRNFIKVHASNEQYVLHKPSGFSRLTGANEMCDDEKEPQTPIIVVIVRDLYRRRGIVIIGP